MGIPRGASGKESACQWQRHKRCGLNTWVRKIPWRRKWQPTPVFFPEKSRGQRSLVGYSPQGHKESDMTECIHTHTNSLIRPLSKWKKRQPFSCIQLFVTPWTISPSLEFSRQKYWSGLPFSSPGDLPNPGTQPRSPVLLTNSSLFEPPGKTLLSNEALFFSPWIWVALETCF